MIDLRFDGRRYAWWQSVEVRESVDDLCATVRLAITRPGVGDSLGLTPNTVAEVLIDSTLVSTIRIDQIRRSVDADSHTISIEGRSLGRELVDCQHSMTLHGLTLGEVVKRICTAFVVPVKVPAKTPHVPDFSMQCEVPANALINAARTSDMLLYSQPDGGLILAPVSDAAPVATLAYGRDLLSYQVVDEYRLRHSHYSVKSYDHGANSALSGAARDDGIDYYRPLHIVADRLSHGAGSCDRRASMERTRRLARSHRLDLTVQGWRHSAGLWAVNTQVRVVIPQEGIDDVFLIGDRAFSGSDKGHITSLAVMPREAWLGNSDAKRAKKGSGG